MSWVYRYIFSWVYVNSGASCQHKHYYEYVPFYSLQFSISEVLTCTIISTLNLCSDAAVHMMGRSDSFLCLSDWRGCAGQRPAGQELNSSGKARLILESINWAQMTWLAHLSCVLVWYSKYADWRCCLLSFFNWICLAHTHTNTHTVQNSWKTNQFNSNHSTMNRETCMFCYAQHIVALWKFCTKHLCAHTAYCN